MKYSTKEDIKSYALILMWPLIMIAIGTGTCTLKQSQCKFVCETNGHKPEYIIAEGCYCRDTRGLFNPKDSRGNEAAGD